ncbi:PTS sugar transporter subunit IIC [Romboutsia lituseburensis]|uniref:Phosphotransferase system, fructose-specific IIC component n=1 Tax=Romboutsia lituseburensis DSM 797 TaxID=1121325 RepID=A0A1G9L1J7_9FIRM|nr:PTS sugar transporter subunit IIC [Romboutsia lituseburensis]CEH35105.1 Perfringolysin O regulator protein [Romboutsia lituseburensis]SDL55643.1 Phosphotransferase system, fructose-specific IIC component [Romboutsia lituseburensis DSM 797]
MAQILMGTGLLLVVLALFTLFSYKAPQGMKAMGALASAACASFLVEAFHASLFGQQMGIDFLAQVGGANGSLGGVAAGILVPLALGVSPVYAVLVGLSVSGFGILPGFVAGYLISFVVKFLEEKVPAGLDLIVIILVAAPLSRAIAMGMDPVVNGTLKQIGQVLIQASSGSGLASQIIMGIILGGIITVVATAPLSSMALTAIISLTGTPMAIGALAVFGSSFMNFVFFSKMKFGSKKDTISVAIEPLTQSDIISANPIPVFVTNFIGGALSGLVVALVSYFVSPITISQPGLATPIAGFAVAVGQNGTPALIAAAGCVVVSVAAGFLGHAIFKNYNIKTADEIRGTKEDSTQAA